MGATNLVIAGLALAAFCSATTAQVRVRGHFRKDGTYVAPHYRSSPNSSRSDNYSARGNYNPYTGRRGTEDPYQLPSPRRWSYTLPPASSAPAYRPQPTYAPVDAAAQAVSVWRCTNASGTRSYVAYPRAGCDEIQITRAPSAAPPRTALTFSGYPCTVNCSGHEAGYAWAEDKGIDDPDDCGGNSNSFIEGCEAYAEEQQEQMIEDGECSDDDEDGLCD